MIKVTRKQLEKMNEMEKVTVLAKNFFFIEEDETAKDVLRYAVPTVIIGISLICSIRPICELIAHIVGM